MFSIGRMIEKCVNISGYGIVRGNLLVTAGKGWGNQYTDFRKNSLHAEIRNQFWNALLVV